MTDLSIFQMLTDELNVAFERNNVDRISALLSADWFIVESATGLSRKTEFLEAIRTGKLIHTRMQKPVMHVSFHERVALVVTQGKNVGSYNDQPFDAEHWVTNTWCEVAGKWECVATHEIPVSCTTTDIKR